MACRDQRVLAGAVQWTYHRATLVLVLVLVLDIVSKGIKAAESGLGSLRALLLGRVLAICELVQRRRRFKRRGLGLPTSKLAN